MRQLAALTLLLALVATPWVVWWHERQSRERDVQRLRQELAQALSAPRVREVVREGTHGVVEVRVPGSEATERVRVERVEVPVPVLTPGGIQVVEVPRVVTVTQPAPCATEEDCRRMFGAAPQAVRVEAALPAGTVVPVRVSVDEREYEVQAPLARDVPLRVELVLSERGVFHALQPAGEPLRITSVRTETTVPTQEPPQPAARTAPEPLQPWRILAGLAPGGTLAVEYENRLASGWYRLQVGWQFGGGQPYVGAWLVFPLR